MGRRVRVGALVKPEPYIVAPCPTCGHPTSVPNGAYLRWRRERAGVDQRTMAQRCDGISGPYLSDIERNRRAAPPFVLAEYYALPDPPARRRRK